jgi:hypothetical protein
MMQQSSESWWGNLTVWGLIGTLAQKAGVNTLNDGLTIVLTVTAIAWTVEKWRVERKRLQGYQISIDGARQSKLGSLWQRMRSGPGALDSKPHVHSYDTDGDPLYRDTGQETQEEVHRGKPP